MKSRDDLRLITAEMLNIGLTNVSTMEGKPMTEAQTIAAAVQAQALIAIGYALYDIAESLRSLRSDR